MINVDRYLNRVPSQHRHKPKLKATITAILEPLITAGKVLDTTYQSYDLDTAVGRQLDIVGEWVGISRVIDTPLDDVYFTWKGTEATGWGAGQWRGRYDPLTGLVNLDDDTYRALIRLQATANIWDGRADSAYKYFSAAFANLTHLVITDHQDMSLTIGIAGLIQGSAQRALFTKQISPFKPAGVRISVYFLSKVNAPLFAWGIDNGESLRGWRDGAWAEKFIN